MISVVMSIYKTNLDYVKISIDSILNQTYKDFEFIVINNGDNQELNVLLERYHDDRIVILKTNPVLTLYEARELGFKKAKFEWVALMDADDISRPNRFKKQIKFAKECEHLKIGAIGTWAKYLNDDGDVIGHRMSRPTELKQHNDMKNSNEAITSPSALINKKAFFEVDGYRPEYSPAADLDLWYRFVEKDYLVLSIPQYLFYYRIHKEAESTKKFMLQRKKTHFANYNMKSRRKGLKEIDYDVFCTTLWSSFVYRFPRMWRNYAKFYYKKAGLNYLTKNYFGVFFNLIPALFFNPGYVFNRILSHKFKAKTLSK